MSSSDRILIIIVTILVPLQSIGATQTHQDRPKPSRVYGAQPIPQTEIEPWREDLSVMVGELERIHPNPYWKTSETRFDGAVADLRDAIPSLSAHEIIVEFALILALVGDGHTSLPLFSAAGVDFHVLPYRLGIYDDGIYVEAADHQYEEVIGGRVISIGGIPAGEALERVASAISRDNENWIRAVAPHLLNRIEVLHALGLAKDLDGAELSVVREGRTITTSVESLPNPQRAIHGLPFLPRYTENWIDARDESNAPVPGYQRRFHDTYWWEYDATKDLLYVKWDQVQNRQSGPSALSTFREAMTFAREQRPAKTVIDIRNNTGGEGGLLPPIIREIVRTREIDEPGKLFLVIGRRTFSAGQMMTAMLEQFSTAILVGEPSSAFYNGYAGHDFATLPNSGISFMVSNNYYQMGAYPRDPRQQATPRLAAVPAFNDYVSNRDPALEAIQHYDSGAGERLVSAVIAARTAGDYVLAETLIRQYDARPVNRFVDSSSVLNAQGYRYLRNERTEEAIALFELNVRVHPRYANGWDSLGEGYARADRREDAIAAFQRALELAPDLASARQWLEKLKGSGS